VKGNYPELSLRLYLQGAEAINRLANYQELEELAYDFCSNSLLIYEEELSDSETKFAALNLIVSTIFNLGCFGPENFDTLITNSVSYCSKLLKKPSQCEALTFAASLYYSHYQKLGSKVMDCLKRAIKISDICMNQGKNLYLFAHILNKYLYYFSIEADFISAKDINTLIELIKE
jgi:vacuolar protein sorting-associated protein 35